jgi:hypothetical protein
MSDSELDPEQQALAEEEADRTRCRTYESAEACDVRQAMYPPSWASIQALNREELIRRFDLLVKEEGLPWAFGPDDYRDELNRRTQDRLVTQLIVLTWVIAGLTVVLVALELVPRIFGSEY